MHSDATSGEYDPLPFSVPACSAVRRFDSFVYVRRQNKVRRQVGHILKSLSPAGEALVSGRLQMPSIIPPNSEPLGDISTDAGWTALTGNQTWVVSSIAGLLFGPIFSSPQSMVRVPQVNYVRPFSVHAVTYQESVLTYSGMRCVVSLQWQSA